MYNKAIQIVSFNNPYPPDFGGVIDVFYKIKALNELGIKVYLHFYYHDRSDLLGLEPYCEKIFIYKKDNSILKHLSFLPFSVSSRYSQDLIENLVSIKAPILFESIRTTSILKKVKLKQKIAIRCHNIEHKYSWGLFRSEQNIIKKIAFLIESLKFKQYENILSKADYIFTISNHEYKYFASHYNKKKVINLPVFQENVNVLSKNGYGAYALYHGDLAVSDNIKSALFIIDVFKDLDEKLIIASSRKPFKVLKEIKKYDNISFQFISKKEQLDTLIINAHINTLYSFQQSGTKLKVFNALFKGRYCIINDNMVDDPNILDICEVINNKKDYQTAVKMLFKQEFILNEKRRHVLSQYNTNIIANILIKTLIN
ncbi:hypothetical protein BWZ22_02070 [Seonamhaeicola sp. S2-3]|uniref:hypothetical protein n=1 Tax=Seonamhaeicola sp. S2-3 TaxID=1936081 RepID=UPI0009726945|nr:hypothetical protein [Seonamhaeicola sp. S2-3]APY10093.1 hypothetical protein BWZ22_02070 [Seonamhaeicola sp. S2-3]